MSDYFQTSVIDTYRQHSYHSSFHSDCSSCHSEHRTLAEFKRENDEKVRKQLAYNKYAHDEAWGHKGQIDDPRSRENPLD